MSDRDGQRGGALCRLPGPALRPYVQLLWASAPTSDPGLQPSRELLLPNGAMHVVFTLGGRRPRYFADGEDRQGYLLDWANIAGLGREALVKERSHGGATVGLLLHPGVGDPHSGTPASLLAGRHTRLAELWPGAALDSLGERMEAAPTLSLRLDVVEAVLARLWTAPSRLTPALAQALARLDRGVGVAQAAAGCGWSHRHFADRFREAVGLSPKAYGRLRRFGRVLDRLNAGGSPSLAEIAVAEGYADQAHMSREFREHAGLSPARYRRLAPAQPHHVPI